MYLRVPPALKEAMESQAADLAISVNDVAVKLLSEALDLSIEDDEISTAELDVEKTIQLLIKSAIDQATVTYGRVAAASHVPWPQAFRRMPQHLAAVWDRCEERALPQLTSLVVNADNGRPSKGLTNLATQRGAVVVNESQYIADRQAECYDWARAIQRPV